MIWRIFLWNTKQKSFAKYFVNSHVTWNRFKKLGRTRPGRSYHVSSIISRKNSWKWVLLQLFFTIITRKKIWTLSLFLIVYSFTYTLHSGKRHVLSHDFFREINQVSSNFFNKNVTFPKCTYEWERISRFSTLCSCTVHLLSLKKLFRQINSLVIHLIRMDVAFTKFFPKKCESKFPTVWKNDKYSLIH